MLLLSGLLATTGLYPRMGFSLTGIEDSTKLSIRITFRQRGNWQVRGKGRGPAGLGVVFGVALSRMDDADAAPEHRKRVFAAVLCPEYMRRAAFAFPVCPCDSAYMDALLSAGRRAASVH